MILRTFGQRRRGGLASWRDHQLSAFIPNLNFAESEA
jgi:hypothetical protein